jgi:DNA-binding MurR/RpiR family transcriptional regulator
VFFAGIGTSGILGKYGARFVSNIRRLSQYLDDPYYPTSSGDHSNSVLIVLSVSGEQKYIIRQINGYKKGKAA